MLTSRLVKARIHKSTVIPYYLKTEDELWQQTASRMLELYRESEGRTRGEIDQEWKEAFGDLTNPLQHQGLAKLLEDRCEFEVVSGHPPEELRAAVFQAAARLRKSQAAAWNEAQQLRDQVHDTSVLTDGAGNVRSPRFDRQAVLERVAQDLELQPEAIEGALFADLRSEQRLVKFKDISHERLLERYNVALAQGVLFKASEVTVVIKNEPPRRYRQLLRMLKFHRLIGEFERVDENTIYLKIDGPLSLFSATQKYGLQLALFLPVVLKCENFELKAELRWGPQRTPKKFRITHEDGLVSHHVDSGMYLPPELGMFEDLFTKKVDDWEILQEAELIPLGHSFWVPDYQLIHKDSGEIVYLEVLGFWRRSSLEKHLEKLREHANSPFLLAISSQLKVEEDDLAELADHLIRFREMPLPKDVVRAANALRDQTNPAEDQSLRKPRAQKRKRQRPE
ncbi:MAG: DUF790 family protein [Gemmataceae bacterium]